MVEISKKDVIKLQKLTNKAFEVVEELDEFVAEVTEEEEEEDE